MHVTCWAHILDFQRIYNIYLLQQHFIFYSEKNDYICILLSNIPAETRKTLVMSKFDVIN